MKRFGPIVGTMLLLGASALAQTTAVSATVTDTDGTVWANGVWHIQFVPSPNNPNINAYNINGTPLDSAVLNQQGNMDGSGALSVSVYQQAPITPVGSSWKLSVCPNTITQCGIYTFTAVGSSMNLSSALTPIIPAPRFHAIAGAYGYNDAEAIIQLIPGSTYWNVTSNTQRCYSGIPTSTWGSCSIGGGNISGTLTPNIMPIASATHILSDGPIDYGVTTPTQWTFTLGDHGAIFRNSDDATPWIDYGVTNANELTLRAPVLTDGAIATTQAPGDNTTKVATDAFVLANAGAGITQLTNDVTAGPGSGSQVATLATVNSGPGSCGDSSHVCQVTTNGKGLVTAQTAVPINTTSLSTQTNCLSSSCSGGSTYTSGPTYTNLGTTLVQEEITMTAFRTPGATGGDSQLATTINGTGGPGNGVWNQCNGVASVTFLVPPGDTFSATSTLIDGCSTGTATITSWLEVTLP